MKSVLLVVGTACLLCIQPASAQQTPIAKSPWCEKFDDKTLASWQKTLVIQLRKTDNGTVADPDLDTTFKLTASLQNILSKAGSQQRPADLLQTMIDSFRKEASDERQPQSHLRMAVDARAGEAALSAEAMLGEMGDDALFPIGLFNRFDQANAESGHCGEARIVYAKTAQTLPARRRFLLIFEGKVTPQGTGSGGKVVQDDCRPVAEFWASLADKTGPTRAADLRKFYFDGEMAGYGKLANPPISLDGLGGSNRGQVRGNIFVDGAWQLREWLIRRHGDRLAFDFVTVKDNPLAEFYNSTSTFVEPARGRAVMADFQKEFVKTMLPNLDEVLPEDKKTAVGQLPLATRIVQGFGFGNNSTARFDEFQSTSQAFADVVLGGTPPDPAPNTPAISGAIMIDESLKTQIDAAKPAGLNPSHVINRAMALTCQGCHQPEGVSRANYKLEIAPAGGENGAPINWPKSLNFVHMDEKSNISEALIKFFLPHRAAVLKDELCRGPDTPANPQSLALSERKAAVALRERSDVTTLRQRAAQADTPAERNTIQDAINSEEEIRRAAERAQPGTYWPLRRTH